MKEEKFKECPRCGKKILKEKTICSFCGLIVKETQLKKDKIFEEYESKKAEKICPICAKPAEDATSCPNCHIIGICAYHIYTFFSDRTNSPMGCPRCGPRCAVCGVQTTLVNYKNRAICMSCHDRMASSGSLHEEERRQLNEKIKRILTTIFTLAGLAGGIVYSINPANQKMIYNLVKIPILKGNVLIAVCGLVGLIIGSIIASIINSFIK